MDQAAAIKSETAVKSTPPEVLKRPQISLIGDVSSTMVRDFFGQLREAEKQGGDLALEITTEGGDAEMARRLVLEIEYARKRLPGRFVFLGKTSVYSAGVTIMSAFPCYDRWLTGDAILMIHGRKLEKTIELTGPIQASIAEVRALCSQMETALKLEKTGFERLIDDCDISMDELQEKALHNWYMTADEARERGLVAGII